MSRTLKLATIVVALTTLACSISIPAVSGLSGSGNVVSLEQDAANFDRVEISSAFHVTITQGASFSVVVRIDDNLQQYLKVQQTGQTLSIGLDAELGLNLGNTTLEADITMPALSGVEASGASQITLVDFVNEGDVALDASGASKVTGDLQAAAVRLTISGASSASLSGSADSLTVEVSGASTASLADFPATDVVVLVSGASKATVNATASLDAEASGASHITYLGSPTVKDTSATGASSIDSQ